MTTGANAGQAEERAERDALVLDAFVELRASGDAALRERLIADHAWMASHVARRFSGRGEPLDDLTQVGQLGLIKAVDRFDPERGTAFGPFAFVTILGEIRRHFRDASWKVKAPRRAKDLQAAMAKASEELLQRFGRSPTADELAERLGVELDDVILAIDARAANRTTSLSGPTGTADEGPFLEVPRAEAMADDEAVAIRALLDRLPERERNIVRLRFYDQLSQSEIAERVGVSQMHVSRLLRVALGTLRSSIETAD